GRGRRPSAAGPSAPAPCPRRPIRAAADSATAPAGAGPAGRRTPEARGAGAWDWRLRAEAVVDGRRPGAGAAGRQMRPNTRVPLVPPKPKPLDTATSTRAWRATLGTESRSQPSPGFSGLMVGGTMPWWIASTEKIASTPPAAPSRWPVIDLVELTIIL